MISSVFRLRAVAVAVAVLALGVGVPPASGAAVRTHSPATISTTHPYTDPFYFPVHSAFGLDCVRDNPRCSHPRRFWAMDIVPAGQFGPKGAISHAGVYAMGAGIVHYGVAHGSRCGSTPTSFGTWVWIDHGGGYVSRYGHLSAIVAKNGAHVAAGQQIGNVGTTGKGGNCSVAYTDFELFHTGVMSTSVQMTTLRACVGSSTTPRTWPTAVYPRYRTWNAVAQNTQFPASTTSCVPKTVPRTAFRPVSTSVSRSGSGQLTVRWAKPSARYHVTRVEVEVAVRRSDGLYVQAKDATYALTSAGSTSHEFSGLARGHVYRTRVSFHNFTGWSHSSSWQLRSVG